MSRTLIAFLTVLVFFCASPLHARPWQSGECPHKDAKPHHSDHEAMTSRGEQGMGFSQTTTTHHFLLKPNGGFIAVTANDKKDAVTREQIREHLSHITNAFAQGEFDIPMFVHNQTPPGVPEMKRLSKKIRYQFHETDQGGDVEVTSTSAEAIRAIHDFLLFQIREHKTGDPTTIP
jgi:hypothetical protein